MTVSLIGQGEELAEEALFLTKFSKHIRVMVTEDEFKCSKESYEALTSSEKVEIITGVKLLEIRGKEYVEELLVEEKGEEKTYKLTLLSYILEQKIIRDVWRVCKIR